MAGLEGMVEQIVIFRRGPLFEGFWGTSHSCPETQLLMSDGDVVRPTSRTVGRAENADIFLLGIFLVHCGRSRKLLRGEREIK